MLPFRPKREAGAVRCGAVSGSAEHYCRTHWGSCLAFFRYGRDWAGHTHLSHKERSPLLIKGNNPRYYIEVSVSYAACKHEFQRNPRYHSSCLVILFYVSAEILMNSSPRVAYDPSCNIIAGSSGVCRGVGCKLAGLTSPACFQLAR